MAGDQRMLCAFLLSSSPLSSCSTSAQGSSTVEKISGEKSEPPRSTDVDSVSSDSNTSLSSLGPSARKRVKVRGRVRKFKKRWLKQYKWLQWEREGMFCKTCKEARKKNPFTSRTGCRNFRTSTLSRHANGRDHRSANQEAVMRKEFATVTQRVLSENEEAVVCAFKAVYWLAKEEIPSSKFPSLLALLEMLGLSVVGKLCVGGNATYTHHSSFSEMQDVINECIQDLVVTELNFCDAYGLMVDKSTDVTITKKLVLNAKIVKHCHTKTRFLSNIDIKHGRAETIYNAIISWAEEKKINLDHFVGFGSDGASVMVGSKTGVATRLKVVNPFIVSIHCAAHRLALTSSQAAKDITYLKRFMEMLHAVYNYFHNSAVQSAKLREVQLSLEEPVRTYKEVYSVCWLSLYNAVDAIVQSWPALHTTLGDEVATKGIPAASGILKFTSQFLFLATCFFLLDTLSIVNRVIKVFQNSDVDFLLYNPSSNQRYQP